jgi:hypothetical protein
MDGEGWAERIALSLEYNWQPTSKYARANLADMRLPGAIPQRLDSDAEPLSVKGDSDQWEEKWIVSTSLSPKAILEKINEQWVRDRRWSQQNSDATAGTSSIWKLTDEKGESWSAVAKVEPAGQPEKLLLILTISRRGKQQ